MFLIWSGELDRASEALREGRDLYESVGDRLGEAQILLRFGALFTASGRREEAAAALVPCAEIAAELGDPRMERDALHILGEIERDLGEFSTARVTLRRSIAMSEELGDLAFASATTHSVGDLELDYGDLAAAQAAYRRGLELAREHGVYQPLVMCLAGLASVAALEGRAGVASVLWGAVRRYESERGVPLFPDERSRYEAILGTDALADGAELRLDEAADYALAVSTRSAK
jgi:tetratricopeptide (TPR) repeat protein